MGASCSFLRLVGAMLHKINDYFRPGAGVTLLSVIDSLTADVGAYVLALISYLLFLRFSIRSFTLFVVLLLYVSLID